MALAGDHTVAAPLGLLLDGRGELAGAEDCYLEALRHGDSTVVGVRGRPDSESRRPECAFVRL